MPVPKASLDGQDPLMRHGLGVSVWGWRFPGGDVVPVETLAGEVVQTSRPIADVVAYLMEVQEG